MNPIEKAKELVDRFFNKHAYMTLEMAIQCALICVDEISKSIIWSSDFKIDNIGDGFTEYLINKGEPFKETGNHPDETQHTNFFNDIIYPKFISEINSI